MSGCAQPELGGCWRRLLSAASQFLGWKMETSGWRLEALGWRPKSRPSRALAIRPSTDSERRIHSYSALGTLTRVNLRNYCQAKILLDKTTNYRYSLLILHAPGGLHVPIRSSRGRPAVPPRPVPSMHSSCFPRGPRTGWSLLGDGLRHDRRGARCFRQQWMRESGSD